MADHIPLSAQAEEQATQNHPAYLYRLSFPDGSTSYLTGWESDIAVANTPAAWGAANPQTFSKAQINHGVTEKTVDFQERKTQITVSSDNGQLQRYFTTAAAIEIGVTVVRCNTEKVALGETVEYTEDCYIVTTGTVADISFSGNHIVANIVPTMYDAAAGIPRYHFQPTCNHALYSAACGVVRASFDWASTITALNRAEGFIELGTAPTSIYNYYRGGYFTHTPSGFKVGIQASGTTGGGKLYLYTTYWAVDWEVGDAVTVFAGCDKAASTCNSKFSNLPNFGGFLFVPNKNPTTNGT